METIKELNVNELEQVNGGANMVCFFIGGSSEPVTQACAYYGTGSDAQNRGGGAIACYYLGIGAGAGQSR